MLKHQPKRILLVDDEHSVRILIGRILGKAGYRVTAVGNVDEALNKIRTEHFDALLCDLKLPEMSDGYTVVHAMRNANPKSAIFVITGYPAVESAVEGIRARIDDYFVKPGQL